MMMSTKSFKVCPGCGLKKQIDSEKIYCKECFRALHYGEIKNNLSSFQPDNFLSSLKEQKAHVYLVTDILTFRSNLIANINSFIKPDHLTIIVNKVDVIPKSISDETIFIWITSILESEKIKCKGIIILASNKNYGIDSLNNDILSKENDVHFIGYSNVGKSTIIQKLSKLNQLKTFNITSFTLGTTLGKIQTKFINDKFLIDYPGFIDPNNYLNHLEREVIKKYLINKEIRTKTFQISKEIFLSIEESFFIKIKVKDKESIQFWTSDQLEIEHKNYSNFTKSEALEKNLLLPNDIISKNLSLKLVEDNLMIVLVGLGIVFLPKQFELIEIYSIKELHWYLEKSFFN